MTRGQPAELVSGTAVTSSDNASLDLLRSAAVIFVFVAHLRLFFQMPDPSPFAWALIGHWGVLIFFLHTSLVLMLSLERQLRRRPDHGLFGEFMLRRAFRVLPLSTFVILGVALLKLPVGHLKDGEFHAVSLSPIQLIYNLLLVQNVTRTESIVAPLWSLSYEMQMYLVLPALFVLVRRSRTVYPALVVWAISACGTLLLSHSRAKWLGDIVAYVPYFMVGIIAYQVLRTRVRTWPFFLWPFTFAGTTLAYLFHPSGVVSFVCCLVLGLSVMRFGELSEGKMRATFRLVARYSYGIYLSHFIVIWLAFCEFPTLPWTGRWLLLLVASVAIPVALYHGLEAPMIALGAKLAQRQRPSYLRVSEASATVQGR